MVRCGRGEGTRPREAEVTRTVADHRRATLVAKRDAAADPEVQARALTPASNAAANRPGSSSAWTTATPSTARGDTNVFGDMRLIGELYRPNLALLLIGGHYTRGRARPLSPWRSWGLTRWRRSTGCTFPILAGTPELFRAELDARRLGQVAVHGWAPVETLGGWARLSAGRAPEPMPAPGASMRHAGPWNGRPRSGNLYSARSDDPCYSLIARA